MPFSGYEIYSQQIDSGKIIILGGKNKKSQDHRTKAYLFEIAPDIDSDQFLFTISELNSIQGKIMRVKL